MASTHDEEGAAERGLGETKGTAAEGPHPPSDLDVIVHTLGAVGEGLSEESDRAACAVPAADWMLRCAEAQVEARATDAGAEPAPPPRLNRDVALHALDSWLYVWNGVRGFKPAACAEMLNVVMRLAAVVHAAGGLEDEEAATLILAAAVERDCVPLAARLLDWGVPAEPVAKSVEMVEVMVAGGADVNAAWHWMREELQPGCSLGPRFLHEPDAVATLLRLGYDVNRDGVWVDTAAECLRAAARFRAMNRSERRWRIVADQLRSHARMLTSMRLLAGELGQGWSEAAPDAGPTQRLLDAYAAEVAGDAGLAPEAADVLLRCARRARALHCTVLRAAAWARRRHALLASLAAA